MKNIIMFVQGYDLSLFNFCPLKKTTFYKQKKVKITIKFFLTKVVKVSRTTEEISTFNQ